MVGDEGGVHGHDPSPPPQAPREGLAQNRPQSAVECAAIDELAGQVPSNGASNW